MLAAEEPLADRATAASERTASIDEAAFHAFYRRHARLLWSYVRRASGHDWLADEILQDAFCRLLRANLGTLDEHALRAYLYRTASNLLIDHWRKAKRERTEPLEGADTLAAKSDPIALRMDLTRTLGVLKPQERALVWLAYVEGEAHEEIAASLNLKVKSVKVLLSRARHKLAQLLRAKA